MIEFRALQLAAPLASVTLMMMPTCQQKNVTNLSKNKSFILKYLSCAVLG
jgi:hypothetical protein